MRFLNLLRGPDAARQELLARIEAGGAVFPYQIALADLHAAQGKVDDSVLLLQDLVANAREPDAGADRPGQACRAVHRDQETRSSRSPGGGHAAQGQPQHRGLKLRAQIRLERGQIDPAIADLRQAINDQPRDTDIMQLLATAYERSGSIELADKQYAEALRASDLGAGIGLAYVGFLQRRGDAARAADVLSDLAARWPSNVQVLSALASVKLSNRDWAGAEEIANALRRLGNRTIPDQILSEALIGRNQLDQSIAVLQSAYSEAPGGKVPEMVALVQAYLRAQQTDKALVFLQGVLKENPANADALVLLGSTQLLSNAPVDAKNSFAMAIERQPKNAAGYQALASLYLQQDQPNEALKVVRAGLAELPRRF